jgi:hypothetical protein
MAYKLPKGHAYPESSEGRPGPLIREPEGGLNSSFPGSTPVTVEKTSPQSGLLKRLDFTPNGLVNGILYSEILGKPLCKRRRRRF